MAAPARLGKPKERLIEHPCPACGGTLDRLRINHRVHAALTVATLGLWGLSWLAVVVDARFRPIECGDCGRRSRLKTE